MRPFSDSIKGNYIFTVHGQSTTMDWTGHEDEALLVTSIDFVVTHRAVPAAYEEISVAISKAAKEGSAEIAQPFNDGDQLAYHKFSVNSGLCTELRVTVNVDPPVLVDKATSNISAVSSLAAIATQSVYAKMNGSFIKPSESQRAILGSSIGR